MRYGGSISIVDDQGNLVFEKELSEDEIIDALLASIPDAEEETPVAEQAQPPAEPKKARVCGKCGQPGHNAKTCAQRGEEDTATWEERKAAEKHAEIEAGVAKLVAEGFSFDEIALSYPSLPTRELEEMIAYAERALD